MPEGIRGRPFEMSRFHCREMLYDYMTGRLDAQRKAAVEKFLSNDNDLKAELDMYIEAAHYCEALSKVQLSDSTIQDLENIRLQSEVVADRIRYRNWPDLLKWSSEAVVISVFVAGLAMVIPWGTIRETFKRPPRNEVVLADVETKPEVATTTAENVAPPVGAKVKPAAGPAAPAPTATAIAAAPVVVAPPAPIPTPVPIVVQPAKPAPEPPKPRLVEKQVGTNASIKPAAKGMLFRILMNKSDIETLAPELRDKIVALGGKKAGEVEIGWRQPGQNYFHFSMPEANYDQLLSILAGMGSSRVYKSPHERVMPEGIMRIILTIKDGPAGKSTSLPSGNEIVPTAPDGATDSAPTDDSSSDSGSGE